MDGQVGGILMQTEGYVVGFEYGACPRMDFSDIVEEFDLAFQVIDAQTRALIWDCDDIAVIERDYMRVALGWLPPDEEEGAWHLIAAVGPTDPRHQPPFIISSFRQLADQIAERMQDVLPPRSVMRGEAHAPVGPELIESLFDLLRETAQMPCDTAPPARPAPRPQPDALVETRDFSGRDDTDFDYDETGIETLPMLPPTGALTRWMGRRAEPTKPMRLTIHALALTLMLYVPPVGAFMFVYTMLRDMAPLSA
jgi:hypothetical protein